MKIGNLDKRVSILTRSNSVDAWNHSVVSFVNRATVWAEVQYKRGTEKNVGQQRVNVDQVHFVMRWHRDVTPLNRLSYDGEQYDIHSVEILGRKEGLRVITTRRDNVEG